MKSIGALRRSFFLRKLSTYLLCVVLPIAVCGTLSIAYYKDKLTNELAAYIHQSKDIALYNMSSTVNACMEETLMFSSTPSLSLAISKLLNEETLDYKNSVYKSMISSILGSSANINMYIDSIYIYFDNPYGNYFDSSKYYTSLQSHSYSDDEWLSIYNSTPQKADKWAALRQIQYYSFQAKKETLSLFRRFYNQPGVMVINLNTVAVEKMLSSLHLYGGSQTVLTDYAGNRMLSSAKDSATSPHADYAALVESFEAEKLCNVTTLQGEKYIFFISDIADYDLRLTTLIPYASVFQTVDALFATFIVMLVMGVLVSLNVSLLITRNNFKQLQNLLFLFETSASKQSQPPTLRAKTNDDYDLIFNNIVSTFISQNALRLHLAQAEMRQKDAQLAALQLQLNPHFIFNTLQTVDMEILRTQPQNCTSRALIHGLSDMLKYSLANTLKSVCVQNEIDICKTYAEIQKHRYENSFLLYFDYSDDVLSLPMAHMILQPLLENSLHHGIKALTQKGFVKIRIHRRKGFLCFSVIDNGVGMSKEQLTQMRENLEQKDFHASAHIGIFNTNLRLMLEYGDEAKIKISSKPNWGTVVKFRWRIRAYSNLIKD